jgi:hypothetical protein
VGRPLVCGRPGSWSGGEPEARALWDLDHAETVAVAVLAHVRRRAVDLAVEQDAVEPAFGIDALERGHDGRLADVAIRRIAVLDDRPWPVKQMVLLYLLASLRGASHPQEDETVVIGIAAVDRLDDGAAL